MRPFFPYYGSKWNVARRYPAPREGLVVEPFAGSAGYATFYRCREVLLLDTDEIIVGVWSYLLKVSPEEILALPELPGAGASIDDHPSLPQEARWLIGFWLNRGSATPKRTRTAYSSRADKAQSTWGAKAKRRIASQLGMIREWRVSLGSYDQAPDRPATWFVDPPYGDKGRFYRRRFAGHAALGEWCRSRRGLLIACEGPGADWLPFEEMGAIKSTRGFAGEFVAILEDGEPQRTRLFA